MTPERTVDRPPEALSHHWNRHKSRHLILRAAIGIACLALGGPTVAGAANGYAGLCIGNAGPTIDRGRIPFHTRDVAPDATAWRLFAGYTVTRNFAVEGAYISLGKARVTECGSPARTSPFLSEPGAISADGLECAPSTHGTPSTRAGRARATSMW